MDCCLNILAFFAQRSLSLFLAIFLFESLVIAPAESFLCSFFRQTFIALHFIDSRYFLELRNLDSLPSVYYLMGELLIECFTLEEPQLGSSFRYLYLIEVSLSFAV